LGLAGLLRAALIRPSRETPDWKTASPNHRTLSLSGHPADAREVATGALVEGRMTSSERTQAGVYFRRLMM
jgi:hypothetical protein